MIIGSKLSKTTDQIEARMFFDVSAASGKNASHIYRTVTTRNVHSKILSPITNYKPQMTADDFAKLVRKGDLQLRADNIVVNAGQSQFRGSGMLQIRDKEFRIKVVPLPNSNIPEHGNNIWGADDFWTLEALLENSLLIKATHVSPHERSSSGGIVTATLSFNRLNIDETRKSDKELKKILQSLQTPLQHDGFASKVGRTKPKPKPPIAQFTAILIDCKLPAKNASTTTTRRNPFLGKAHSWKGDTLFLRGSRYDVALIQQDNDLHIHLRSKGRYSSDNAAEDATLFKAVLKAVAFCYGFNPWPYRQQQWRNGQKEIDYITAPRRLPVTRHAPFDEELGQDAVPPILLATQFFAQNSDFSKQVSELLFVFRQAGDKPVHLPIQTIALCSLFEGFINLLFKEMKLEKKIKDTDPDHSAFVELRDELLAELRAKKNFGDAASKRLEALVSQARELRPKDKFEAICKELDLDYTAMKPHIDAWSNERNPLMHGTWRPCRDSDFANQAKIAGAINILLLKIMKFSGRVVAVHSGDSGSKVCRAI